MENGLKACNFIKNETLAQVFCCEFCEIFKNSYFVEHLRTIFFARTIKLVESNLTTESNLHLSSHWKSDTIFFADIVQFFSHISSGTSPGKEDFSYKQHGFPHKPREVMTMMSKLWHARFGNDVINSVFH